jgi:biopolymer transport protein ExbB
MNNPLFKLIQEGGPWIMVPLLICSVVAIAIIIERMVALRRASADSGRLMERVREAVLAGNLPQAIKIAEQGEGPAAAVIAGGLRNADLGHEAIERAMEELAMAEVPELSRRLAWLDTIVTLAPLLGLRGTVTGIITAFQLTGGAGAAAVGSVTGGVAEALYATATGLTVAVVALVFYNYLTDRVREIISTMELRATQLLNLLAAQREREPARR